VLSQSVWGLGLCVSGLVGATLSARVLEPGSEAFRDGVGGFNGALAGLALWALFEATPELLLIAFVCGVLTGLVRVGLLRFVPLPPFTAPFVLVTWLAEYAGRVLLNLEVASSPAFSGGTAFAAATNASQVLFVSVPWVGALVILAVALHSRVAALWVALASVVGWLTTAGSFGTLPADLAAEGLLGYNALILAAAMHMLEIPRLVALVAVVASVWLSALFFLAPVPTLSAPFVLVIWLVISGHAWWDGRGMCGHPN
jgi:urea transporter